MILLGLLRRHDDTRVFRILALSAVGGLLAAGTVAAANIASNGEESSASLGLGLAFLAALAIMFWCERWSARALVELYEDVQQTLRAELAERLRSAPLRSVERLHDERGRAVGALTTLSTAVTQIVTLVQQASFLACMSFIIATVSIKALLIWLITGAAIAYWLSTNLRTLGALQSRQSRRAGTLHTKVEELLDGFMQLKLDPQASDVSTNEIHAASSDRCRGQVELTAEHDRNYLVANALFYGVGFGLAVFAPERPLGLDPLVGYEMTILLALSIGPLFNCLQAIPAVSEAESAASTVLEVLEGLAVVEGDVAGEDGGEISELELRGVAFTYETRREAGSSGFTVGPIDLTLRRGDLVFITGGNGSGKTTLMKMLLGLYPVEGLVRWDGQPVRGDHLARYRGLFTAIFGGQFLFDRLYGLDVPRERLDDLLERFGIADVVRFDGTRFQNLELSSGQRMRLAMVVALLEDRPVCVFDEWTANQDPKSTWFYYETLLPELIRAGKTVIAVSHDDRFFARADHLIQLEQGRVIVDRRQASDS